MRCCRRCASQQVQLVWVVWEPLDLDSWLCLDCGHRWVTN